MSKIKELEKQIKEASEAYYNDAEIISDDEYDALVYELSILDPKNKLLIKVGAEPSSEWKKEKHLFSLGSLNKVNTVPDMEKWIEDHPSPKGFLIVEKLDGLSLGATYQDGKLISACLRGNGLEGENILSNVIKMKGVVKSIPNFTGVLRGEIILTKTDHQKHFPDYANPRNAASGLCRRLDGEGCEHLTLMFYQVLGKEFATEKEQFSFMEKAGCLLPNYKLCKNAKEIDDIWKEYHNKTRDALSYEIDGLVATLNDTSLHSLYGEHNLRPKYKLALKFANQFVKTTVQSIDFQVGNSGRITPVCWVEPVDLLGSTVQKASLYNMAYIDKLKIDVGAEVLICKAGEIIPRIEKVVKGTGTVAECPERCPSCDADTIFDGENLMCSNKVDCPAQTIGKITNWISTLNILEWGEALIERLCESGLVETIADLYRLSIKDLMTIERMGEKSSTKCYELLHAHNPIELELFIGGLSIPMIGTSSIKMIMNDGYDTLEKIQKMAVEELSNISGLGPIKSQALFDGLKSNEALIKDILSCGIKIKKKTVGKLTGMSFVFTGTMTHKRADLETMVVENGGEVKSSVGTTTTHLVINDISSQSSKAVKARKLGTSLLSEENFLKLVE